MICARPHHGSCSATGVRIRAVACPSALRYIPPPREQGCASGLAVSGGRIYGYQVKPPALLQAEPAPECAQWEWCCLGDVVPVSRHSLGAEAAAAPTAHPVGADPKKLAEGNCSELVDLGVVFLPLLQPCFSIQDAPHKPGVCPMGWKAAALDNTEQSRSTSSPKPPKSGWRRDPSVGLCHPKAPRERVHLPQGLPPVSACS